MAAKGLAWAAGKPFIAVNHLEAHALAARLAPGAERPGVEFPYLLLLVSGGHTSSSPAPGSVATANSGPAVTTPPARPSTRPRSCWASLSGRSGDRTRRARRRPSPLHAAASPQGPRRLRILVFRAEDRGAAHCRRHGGARRPDRAAGCLRPCRRGRGGGLRYTGRSHRHAICQFRRDYPEGKALVAAGGVAANAMLRRRLGNWPLRPGSILSLRRRRYVPTTA